MYPSVRGSTIYNSQDMEATWMSISWGIDKEDMRYTHTHTHTHTHNGILLGHTKEWNNSVCGDMDGPRDCHTEWSMSDRERQISYDIAYMWNLKK